MFGLLNRIYGRSPSWRKVRAEYLKNNPECAACGRTEDLEVHHIIPYHKNPDLELETSNLITLCGKYCHFVFGHFMNWKSWNENVIKDAKLYYEAKSNRPEQEPEFGSHTKGICHEILINITRYADWVIIKLKRWHDRPKN